ncbi:MAG TPA: histidine phosphatase family protein [Tepidisphaeraceae bacterium]
MPNRLILIKHAAPEVVPTVPSEQWHLSERGRASCAALAEAVRAHEPRVVVSSTEPKAIETAELVASALKIPHEPAPDLHEHDRSNVPHMRSSEFISMVELFFRRPDELVLGQETAGDAEERFTSAVEDVVKEHAGRNVAIVAHGTVIALMLARYSDRPAFAWWRELGLPSMVVLELPEYRIVQTIGKMQA